MKYTVWAKHPKINRWVSLEEGLSGHVATEVMVMRADRCRRRGIGVHFRALPEGEKP